MVKLSDHDIAKSGCKQFDISTVTDKDGKMRIQLEIDVKLGASTLTPIMQILHIDSAPCSITTKERELDERGEETRGKNDYHIKAQFNSSLKAKMCFKALQKELGIPQNKTYDYELEGVCGLYDSHFGKTK